MPKLKKGAKLADSVKKEKRKDKTKNDHHATPDRKRITEKVAGLNDALTSSKLNPPLASKRKAVENGIHDTDSAQASGYDSQAWFILTSTAVSSDEGSS
eukprot:scaffold199495_cov42-Prasinocladus_malaysianus.AAC.1